MKTIKILFQSICLILFFFTSYGYTETLNKIEIIGNDRITDETIKLFISVDLNDDLNDIKLNKILKDLYETDFFKDVSVNFYNKTLTINVLENPIIENIFYNGIKSNRILDIIKKETSVKSRSSFNQNVIKKEISKIESILKNLGYYNSSLDTLVEQKENNLVNLTYNIDLGKKSKIKKITFIGNKIFKDKKLRRVYYPNDIKFGKLIWEGNN